MTTHLIPRAYVRQRSGLHLNLLDPSPESWTDEDLAIGLSRTYRWGGHSVWPLPLSVAQHSLTVLALFKTSSKTPVSKSEALRELLHDADEALIGGFDPISPLKPLLGSAYATLAERLQNAVLARYNIHPWDSVQYKSHKHADNLAGASEAVHVAGWKVEEVHDLLNIGLNPLKTDPLVEIYDCKPWEPWKPNLAAKRYLEVLTELGDISK